MLHNIHYIVCNDMDDTWQQFLLFYSSFLFFLLLDMEHNLCNWIKGIDSFVWFWAKMVYAISRK